MKVLPYHTNRQCSHHVLSDFQRNTSPHQNDVNGTMQSSCSTQLPPIPKRSQWQSHKQNLVQRNKWREATAPSKTLKSAATKPLECLVRCCICQSVICETTLNYTTQNGGTMLSFYSLRTTLHGHTSTNIGSVDHPISASIQYLI